jgi:hypothetical protein
MRGTLHTIQWVGESSYCPINPALSIASCINIASAGETNRDLAATQFTKNCLAYNITEVGHYKFKTI